jgi:hypothetical protein
MRQDPLLVLMAMFAVSFVLRMRMLGEIRSWSAQEKARLIDSFNQQQRITSGLLLAVLIFMMVPLAIGEPSLITALLATFTAAAIAVAGGAWSNLKLRRLGFPPRYVWLHAIQVTAISLGVIAYSALIVLSL